MSMPPSHVVWNKHHPNDRIERGDGYCIHHKDFNHENNTPDNLQKLLHEVHTSLHHKNKKVSKQTRNKISKIQKGRKLTSEWKKNVSDAMKGKEVSIQHREHLSKALNGRVFTEEWKKKISESRKGKIPWNKGLKGKQTHTEEWKRENSRRMKKIWRKRKCKSAQ